MVDMFYVKSVCLASWLEVCGPSGTPLEVLEQPPRPIDAYCPVLDVDPAATGGRSGSEIRRCGACYCCAGAVEWNRQGFS